MRAEAPGAGNVAATPCGHDSAIPTMPRPETVVLAHGCFDLLHAGHIEHLLEAKKLGDRLIVSITADERVRKGAWRPQYTAAQRANHLRCLGFVDRVIISEERTAAAVIGTVKPDIYVKGIDYAGKLDGALAEEIAILHAHGGRFVPTKAPKQSSSRLLAALQHGEEVSRYLEAQKAKGAWERIEAAFAKARDLVVTFVGETIIDEYRYVSPLGKPSKEFILAVVEDGDEVFEGGVVAAARHADGLCKASLVTHQSGELRKTRFVSRDFGHKLFEVYSAPRLVLADSVRDRFLLDLEGSTRYSDLIVVFDFGHGLIDMPALGILKDAKFLAVNAQSNAGNQGFNSVMRYKGHGMKRYVCVDTQEARLALQSQRATPADCARYLGDDMGGEVIVTAGRDGAYWRNGHVPPFLTTPRDTIGAGDAFLAVTAPLIAAGLEAEEAALVGNVAGAMKTEIMGHRAGIDGDTLYQSVRSLLR